MKYSHGFVGTFISISLLGLSACDAPSGGSDARWEAGVHYEVLPGSPLSRSGSGKVQVVEFFSYGCGHCYSLDPQLVLWSKRKPDNIEFIQVPTQGRAVSRAYARLYYTLKALGRLDLHPLVFDAIHRRGELLETREQQSGFLRKYGISDTVFTMARTSPDIERALVDADKVMRRFLIDSVPAIVIDGKYKTGLVQARGSDELIELITALTKRK